MCPAQRTDIQTWNLVSRSRGRISRSSLKIKVIGHRSKVKVTGSKNVFLWDVIIVIQKKPGSDWYRWNLSFFWSGSRGISDLASWIKLQPGSGETGNRVSRITVIFSFFVWYEITIYSTPYMNGRATVWGVFKAYVFFLDRNYELYQKLWIKVTRYICC